MYKCYLSIDVSIESSIVCFILFYSLFDFTFTLNNIIKFENSKMVNRSSVIKRPNGQRYTQWMSVDQDKLNLIV